MNWDAGHFPLKTGSGRMIVRRDTCRLLSLNRIISLAGLSPGLRSFHWRSRWAGRTAPSRIPT
ncbi:protein of unknown function [Bradyrhizobium vignae]|uniref:Uncharacterized protein n=1 Tax=Bradyrhizobium vignae TaxID=1549949 RepID=A0A2U3Q076_9BRAD|nr:protein of unknown function [Bradyrhizobium vignae]